MNDKADFQSDDNAPRPVDVHVGRRLRLRRLQRGLSQSQLAHQVGISFQAVQKYETGGIRISASRLYEFTQVLEVSSAFFFDGYTEAIVAPGMEEEVATALHGEGTKRTISALIRGFYAIHDEGVRDAVKRLLLRLGKQHDADRGSYSEAIACGGAKPLAKP